MIKAKALQKGDLVAVAAPASPFDRKEFLAGVKKIKELGFEVTFRKDIFAKKGYLAGTDERRADELNQFFGDPEIKAIFFARGGYGTQRILHLLDIEAIKTCPKIILGCSDITALHAWLYRHEVGGTFYGPTIARQLRLANKGTVDSFIAALFASEPLGKISSAVAKTFKKGAAEGVITGGCLSLIVSSIGTPYELPTDNSILFLEDVGESVYKYDRMLTHLKASGKLRNVRGLIFGSLGLSGKNESRKLLNKMLEDVLADFPGPIITNFPSGHLALDKLFVTLPFGVAAKITTHPVCVSITEPALI
ncbi:MAG: LD-carboxypeptidase [Deltaproteobacteria bacterium]|nr:LD-carboxypeptidase [Deltaproteobacteria bacterium]